MPLSAAAATTAASFPTSPIYCCLAGGHDLRVKIIRSAALTEALSLLLPLLLLLLPFFLILKKIEINLMSKQKAKRFS